MSVPGARGTPACAAAGTRWLCRSTRREAFRVAERRVDRARRSGRVLAQEVFSVLSSEVAEWRAVAPSTRPGLYTAPTTPILVRWRYEMIDRRGRRDSICPKARLRCGSTALGKGYGRHMGGDSLRTLHGHHDPRL